MRIVHCCLSCFYIDGYAYQENQLVAEHVKDGHQVTVIASTESFGEDRLPCYVIPGDYVGTDGARVIRLPYRKIGFHFLATKVRSYPDVYDLLKQLSPDVIFFHGLCAYELLTVARYASLHSGVTVYADCHEDFNNSARSILSKWLLHYCFYRPILSKCLPIIRKVLCISQEAMDFARIMYGVPMGQLEFYPLGGDILSDEEYSRVRERVRSEFGWNEESIVFMQTGKLDQAKKLGASLRAFLACPGSHLRFVIVGQILQDVASEVVPLIESDDRILNYGWVQASELRQLLCAADIYVQPGSQSATMQMSLCCRRPVVLDDVSSHRVFIEDNGFLVSDEAELTKAFARFSKMSRLELDAMSSKSLAVAARLLDYRLLARRVLV